MGTTYYVSTNGNDASDGLTPATALATGSRAATLFNGLSAGVQAQGVSVLWDNGTYNEPGLSFTPQLGSNGGTLLLAPLHLRIFAAASGMPVKLNLTTDPGAGIGGVYINNTTARTQNTTTTQVCGVTVLGLEVTDASTGQALVAGVEIGVPNGAVTACYVHDIGVGLSAGATGGAVDNIGTGDGTNPYGFSVTRCLIIHCGPSGGGGLYHGIYPGSPYSLIANNIVGNCPGGWAIHAYAGSTNCTIINNTCFNYGSGGIVWGSPSIASTGNKVYNNICHGNSNAGTVGLESQSALPGSVDHSDVENNLCWHNAVSDAPVFNDATAHTSLNNLVGDPLFVNYQASGSGDYHLSSGSPAIDTGTALSAQACDFAGTPRPLGGAYDMGAYEAIGNLLGQRSNGMGFIRLDSAPQIATGAAPTLSNLATNVTNASVVGTAGRGYILFTVQTATIPAGTKLFTVTFASALVDVPTVLLNGQTGFAKTTAGFIADSVTANSFIVVNKDTLPVIAGIECGYLVVP